MSDYDRLQERIQHAMDGGGHPEPPYEIDQDVLDRLQEERDVLAKRVEELETGLHSSMCHLRHAAPLIRTSYGSIADGLSALADRIDRLLSPEDEK